MGDNAVILIIISVIKTQLKAMFALNYNKK